MKQFHSLCPFCDIDRYQQIINSIEFQDYTLTPNILQYVLNPVIRLKNIANDDPNFQIKQQRIQDTQRDFYEVRIKKFDIQIDILYGVDFFFQGCQFIMNGEVEKANTHFKMFDTINQFIQPMFERQIPSYEKFSKQYFGDVCQVVLKIQQRYFSQLKSIIDFSIKQFMLDRYSSILSIIESIQFSTEKFNEKSTKKQLEIESELNKCQVKLALLSGNFTEQAIFTKTFKEHLQNTDHIYFIGYILFTELNNCEKLWEIFFKKLNGQQRFQYITNIIILYKKNYQEQILFCLLKLGKGLKKLKEYWLSLAIFSLIQKISKQFKHQFDSSSYQPYLNTQIAKICIYLGQFQYANTLYCTAYQQLEKLSEDSKFYNDSKSKVQLRSKLRYKIIILSMFLMDKNQTLQHLLEVDIEMPEHIKIFINFYKQYLQNVKHFQGKKDYRKCDEFLKYLQDIIIFNLDGIQIPDEYMKTDTNLIQLKDKDFPQATKMKMAIKFEFKFNSYFNILQFYLILVCHLKKDILTTKDFYQKRKIMDWFLQQVDSKLYKTISNVIENFSFPKEIYENLLLSHFYSYIQMFDLCQKKLQLFEETLRQNIRKYSDSEYNTFQNIISQYQSIIQQQRLKKYVEQCAPEFQHYLYTIGGRYLNEGNQTQGIKHLEKASLNKVQRDQCISLLLKQVQISKQDFQIVNPSQFNGDIKDIINQNNFEKLHQNQTIENPDCRVSQRMSQNQEQHNNHYDHLVESIQLSQISRNSSFSDVPQQYDLKQFKILLNNSEINELIERIEEEFPNIEQFDQDKFKQTYKLVKIIKKEVNLYESNNQYIIQKTKSFTEKNQNELQKKLKDILIEVFVQVLVNKLNHRGFAKLIGLQYQIVISQQYASQYAFYMMFAYYEPLPKLNINQLKDLIASVKILNENYIYHRDLKLENIVIEDGKPVIIDFDCAMFKDQILQKWFRGKGLTLEYYPDNEPVDRQEKVDIFQLGMIGMNVDNCPQEFYKGATSQYQDRYSFEKLLQLLN